MLLFLANKDEYKRKRGLNARIWISAESRVQTCWGWTSRMTWFLTLVGLRSFSLDAGWSPLGVALAPPCTMASLQNHEKQSLVFSCLNVRL